MTSQTISESNCIIYADDTTLFAGSRNPSNIEFSLNQDLRNVTEWFAKNRLKLNIDKTKFMVIHPRNMEDQFTQVNIFAQGRLIKREASIKILGVTLDQELKWHEHIRGMLRNLRFQYRSFSRSMKYFDRDTRIIVYNSSMASRFNYADVIWSQCIVKQARMLHSVQNVS